MRREKTQISKIRIAKGEITINTMLIQGISETTLRTYILINLKILKKWTDF
jgi:LEA14-like dessication related protein